MEVLSRELLEDVARMKPPISTGEERRNAYGGENGFDLASWIEDKGIGVVREGAWSGTGHRWVLEECPWNGHTDNAPYIVRLPTGAIGAGCHHNSCQGYGWRELREHYEPGCYDHATANGEAFEDRIYFGGVKNGSGARLPPVPRFPVEVLPTSLNRFVGESAASVGCPPEFIAVPMFTTLGAAIGNSRVLRMKKGYTQGTALYTAIVADPGARKSPALAVATAPANARQDKLKREYGEAMSEYRREKMVWEAEKRRAMQGDKPIPEPPEKPTLRRTVINDTTVEALFPLLDANPRGLLSSNDELSGWAKSMDQYKGGKGSDRQKYLSMTLGGPSCGSDVLPAGATTPRRSLSPLLDRPQLPPVLGLRPQVIVLLLPPFSVLFPPRMQRGIRHPAGAQFLRDQGGVVGPAATSRLGASKDRPLPAPALHHYPLGAPCVRLAAGFLFALVVAPSALDYGTHKISSFPQRRIHRNAYLRRGQHKTRRLNQLLTNPSP
jgi:hypothetical protein